MNQNKRQGLHTGYIPIVAENKDGPKTWCLGQTSRGARRGFSRGDVLRRCNPAMVRDGSVDVLDLEWQRLRGLDRRILELLRCRRWRSRRDAAAVAVARIGGRGLI